MGDVGLGVHVLVMSMTIHTGVLVVPQVLIIVDQEAFDRIECNRCGQCCQGMVFGNVAGPLQLLEMYGRGEARGEQVAFRPVDFMEFTGQLEPYWDAEREFWRYRCGYLSIEDGIGVCAIYDRRPEMCRDFPYKKPTTSYTECVWNVEILDYEVML